jgi:DNA-binding Lrp family transcriptional regulator
MSPRKTSFDELDYLIIQALHAEARANERTARKRIDRLVADGVIRLTAILDPLAFGYLTAAEIFLEADPAREDAILQRLMAIPEVTYVTLGQARPRSQAKPVSATTRPYASFSATPCRASRA